MIFTRGNVAQSAVADETQKAFKDILRAGVDVTRDGLAGTYVNYANGEQSPSELYGYEPWRVARLNRLADLYDPGRRFGYFAGFREAGNQTGTGTEKARVRRWA